MDKINNNTYVLFVSVPYDAISDAFKNTLDVWEITSDVKFHISSDAVRNGLDYDIALVMNDE